MSLDPLQGVVLLLVIRIADDEADARGPTEATREDLSEDREVVLLEPVTEEWVRNLEDEFFTLELEQMDWLEPGLELLGGDLFTNLLQNLRPRSLCA